MGERTSGSAEDRRLDKIFELAAKEILRRLEDDGEREDSKKLPSYRLFQLIDKIEARQERKRRELEREASGPEVDVLDLVRDSPMSVGAKLAALRAEVKRTELRLRDLRRAEGELDEQ